MIAYAPEAEPARAYLLRGYNDIDIYVEDVTAQNAYVRLFSRILNGIAVVNQVYPLTDRAHVLAACAGDQGLRSRKRIYIIDADQDLIHGRPCPALQHLYRLGVYSSENLMLSEAAAIAIAMECATNDSWHDLALRLDFKRLLEGACASLLPLFVLYGLVEEFDLGVQTVKYPVQRLFSDDGQAELLDRSLIRKRALSLRAEIVGAVGLPAYSAARNIIFQRVLQDTEISKFISGKTYLLPIVHKQLMRAARFQGSSEVLKVRLAATCELHIDPNLSDALHGAMQ